jgi:hypothetical protein
MAGIKAGDPATKEGDDKAFEDWIKERPTIEQRLAVRKERLAAATAFKKAQGRDGFVCLGIAFDWLEECDAERASKRIAAI